MWTPDNWNIWTPDNWNIWTLDIWNISARGDENEKMRIYWKNENPLGELETGSRGLKMGPAQRFLRHFRPSGADESVCKTVFGF